MSSLFKQHPRLLQLLLIALALTSGFFIYRFFIEGPEPRTQAQSGVGRDEESNTSIAQTQQRLDDILVQLRRKRDTFASQSAPNLTRQSIISSSTSTPPTRPVAQQASASLSTANDAKSVQTFPTSLSPFGAPSRKSSPSSTASPSVAIVGRILIEQIMVEARMDGSQTVLDVETLVRNTGATPSVNTPIKIFVTGSDGNSMYVGEQLIPSLAPGQQKSTKNSHTCLHSGTVNVCAVVSPDVTISSVGAQPLSVCKTITIPQPVAASAAPSTSTGATSSSGCSCSH